MHPARDEVFFPPAGAVVPTVSAVIPCFNEAPIAGRTARRVAATLDAAGAPWELLFWDDGSTDATREILSAAAAANPRIGWGGHAPNRGAGRALRALYARTRGRHVLQMDCDLASPPEEFVPAALDALTRADLALVTRYGARPAVYPLRRRVVSRAKTALYKAAFGMPVSDSCSGFYGFDGGRLRTLDLASDGFEIQLEFILRARDLGWTIVELELPWVHQTESGEMSLARESWRTARGRVRLGLRRLRAARGAAP